MSVDALVVSYHTGPRLRECLYALAGEPQITAIRIADNGNTDADRAWLAGFAAARPARVEIRVLPNPGFGAAVNALAKVSRAEVLLVINPDCVIKRGAVGLLRDAMAGRKAPTIVGGRIFGMDGREQRGARRNTLTLMRAAGLGRWTLEGEPPPDGPIPVGAISGAFFAVRREDFERLGGFDEGYFLHVEDIDLCRRAWEAGGEVIYQPRAGALHYLSTSDAPSAAVLGYKAQSLARYFRKFARGPFERAAVELAIPAFGLILARRAG